MPEKQELMKSNLTKYSKCILNQRMRDRMKNWLFPKINLFIKVFLKKKFKCVFGTKNFVS
jgi:hypothetical protein